jgi:hypothetical protein
MDDISITSSEPFIDSGTDYIPDSEKSDVDDVNSISQKRRVFSTSSGSINIATNNEDINDENNQNKVTNEENIDMSGAPYHVYILAD